MESASARRRVAVARGGRRRSGAISWRYGKSNYRAQCWARHSRGSKPLFEEWLERSHGVLTYRLTQVLTGHGCFRRFLCQIRAVDSPGCHHFVERPNNTVEHTVVWSAWVEHRRVLVEAIGGDDLLHPALVEAMVRRGPEM